MNLKHEVVHFFRACDNSLRGFKLALHKETAVRQEVILTIIIIPLACWLAKDKINLILMISSWLLVLIVELINSAIEATLDRLSTEQHLLIGYAKDVASCAVGISIILAIMVWLVLLF